MTIRTTMTIGGAAALLAAGVAAFLLAFASAPSIAQAECSNGSYSFFGPTWSTTRRFGYFTNVGTFPHTVAGQRDEGRKTIVRGHNVWDLTKNDCGNGDQNNVNTDWLGDSGCRWSPSDGTNCVDFGPMGPIGCSGALACATNRAGSDGRSAETDQRYSSDNVYWWTYVTAMPGHYTSSYYDLYSVAAHETGHSIGLGHTTASSGLTMYPSIGTGQRHWRTLGRGDIRGMRARYPRSGSADGSYILPQDHDVVEYDANHDGIVFGTD
jgi:hypothetical protein